MDSQKRKTSHLCATYLLIGGWLTLFAVRVCDTAPDFVQARTMGTEPKVLADGGAGSERLLEGPGGKVEALQMPLVRDPLPKGASAAPAYMLRLHIDAGSDVNALVRYWGKGGREKLISPLLHSLQNVPGGGAMNVSYFFPPYARLRLYTFPEDWTDQHTQLQDCTFTALNFFNDRADTNLFDIVYRERFFNSQYALIGDEPQFGDLVAMLNSENQMYHTCVYVVSGFVFTKNGVNSQQPWILMKLSDMLAMYDPTGHSHRVVFLRRKAADGVLLADKAPSRP